MVWTDRSSRDHYMHCTMYIVPCESCKITQQPQTDELDPQAWRGQLAKSTKWTELKFCGHYANQTIPYLIKTARSVTDLKKQIPSDSEDLRCHIRSSPTSHLYHSWLGVLSRARKEISRCWFYVLLRLFCSALHTGKLEICNLPHVHGTYQNNDKFVCFTYECVLVQCQEQGLFVFPSYIHTNRRNYRPYFLRGYFAAAKQNYKIRGPLVTCF